MRGYALPVALACLMACYAPSVAPPLAPSVEPAPAGGVEDGADGDYPVCTAACVRLRALRCPEGQPEPGGKTCTRLCVDAERSRKFALKPGCVSVAMTVDAVRACGSVRCLP